MANGSGGSPGTSVTSKGPCLPEAFTPSTPVLTLTERAAAGRGAVRMLTRVGGRFAPATGVGLVLLAHAPRKGRGHVYSTGRLFKLMTMSHVNERPVR